MTSRDFIRLFAKRWYVVLAATVLMALVALPILRQDRVYFAQFNVVVLPPTYEFFPNKYEDAQYGLAPLASVVVVEWNGDNQPLLTASSDSTLYGQGVRKGSLVRMPNHGNQWQPLYTTPTIDVQIVDSSPELVLAEARRITSGLADLLDRLQEDLAVAPGFRATLLASSSDPPVYPVSGSRIRSLGALGAAGIILVVVSVLSFERLLAVTRRRSERRRAGSRPPAELVTAARQ